MVGATQGQEVMKLFVTGAGGQLGHELVAAIHAAGHEAIDTTHAHTPARLWGAPGRSSACGELQVADLLVGREGARSPEDTF